jgi:hypothetical protein
MQLARDDQPVTMSPQLSEGQAFTFDTTDPILFEIMSARIYTKPFEAVAREISCNAYDQHLKDGVTRPFLVVSPSYSEPMATFRDYGKGLTHEDLIRLSTGFGASDNRKHADTNGGFGLGMKSPFAIADTYTITRRYGDEVQIYTMTKDNHVPKVSFLPATPRASDDPTGLEFRIPVASDKFLNMRGALQTALQWFPQDSFTTVGFTVSRPTMSLETPSWAARAQERSHKYNYSEPSVVLMGTVAYRIDFDALDVEKIDNIVLKVPVGSVQPQSSREGLYYSDNTKVTLLAAIAQYQLELKDTIKAALQSAPTVWAKAILLKNLKQDFAYAFPKEEDKPWPKMFLPSARTYYVKDGRKNPRVEVSHSEIFASEECLFIVDDVKDDRIKQRILYNEGDFPRKIGIYYCQAPLDGVPPDQVRYASMYEAPARKAIQKSAEAVLYDVQSREWKRRLGHPSSYATNIWFPMLNSVCEVENWKSFCNQFWINEHNCLGLTGRAQREWLADDDYEWARYDEFIKDKMDECLADPTFLEELAWYRVFCAGDEHENMRQVVNKNRTTFTGFSTLMDQYLLAITKRTPTERTRGFEDALRLFPNPKLKLPKITDFKALSDRVAKRYPLLRETSHCNVNFSVIKDHM